MDTGKYFEPQEHQDSSGSQLRSQTVIFDIGTHAWKAGFSNCEFPDAVIPSLIGMPKSANQSDNTDIYLGTEAYKMCPVLDLRYPIEYGIIVDWSEFEEIFHFMMFNALEIASTEELQETSVYFTEPIFNPKANKHKLAELAFEKFGIQSMVILSQAYWAMISEGNTSGLVVDIGESQASVVPIYDNRILDTAISRLDIGGRTLNEYLVRMLKHKISFLTSYEKEIARFIKEETWFVQPSANYFDHNTLRSVSYELPDGNSLDLKKTQYLCPELLFDTSLIGRESGSVQESISNSLKKTDSEINSLLAQNIILTGGSSQFKGFDERLQLELLKLNPELLTDVQTKGTFQNRNFASWLGAALLSNLCSTHDLVVTKEMYEEEGARLLSQTHIH